MDIQVKRNATKDGATMGRMTVDSGWICYTLENPVREVIGQPVESWKIPAHTAIGIGTYEIALLPSAHFGRIMPHLLNVPGFDGILIHPGNEPADTAGCILVGFTIENDTTIGASRGAFSALFTQIEDAITAGQKVLVTIA
jgi:hypothetical protein